MFLSIKPYLLSMTLTNQLVLLAAVTACEPSTSSSSNWLRCSTISDCPTQEVARCSDGYCVDSKGDYISSKESPASGGKGPTIDGTSSDESGGAALVSSKGGSIGIGAIGGHSSAQGGSLATSGTSPQGGSVATSGTNPQGGSSNPQGGSSNPQGGSSNPQGGSSAAICTTFDAAFVESLKSCSVDTDCAKIRYTRDCCGTNVWVAVRSDRMNDMVACLETRPEFPACGCASFADTVEDGRVVNGSGDDVVARCVANQCQSRVKARTCGLASPTTCTENQLCVAYETTIGPSSTTEYACVTNPCTGTPNCTCAQSICDQKTDALRSCYIPPLGLNSTTVVDVGCQDNRQ
jgi:hypothetical protein